MQIRDGIVRPGDLTGWPTAEVHRRQAWRPAAPEERAPAEAVRQSREGLIAVPRVSPNQILGPGILGIAGHHLLCRPEQAQPRHVLNVCRQQEGAGFDDENAQTDVLATTVNLLRDVPAEQAGPDDDNVERVAAIAGHFAPCAAHPAAKHVMRECGLLDINDKVRIGVEARQHRRLLGGIGDLQYVSRLAVVGGSGSLVSREESKPGQRGWRPENAVYFLTPVKAP